MLFQATGLILILANLGSGLTGQVSAARLLFGMGRDNVLPRKIFAHLDPKKGNPTYNIWVVGLLAFGGSLVVDYELGAECLNFAAFLAFMGVNLAALQQLYVKGQPGQRRRLFADAVVPGLGFLFCLGICLSLPTTAKIAGGLCLGVGLVYDAVQTRGFRRRPTMIRVSEL